MCELENVNVRSVKYEEIQERDKSVLPKDERICNGKEWSTDSKAEDRGL